MFGIARSCVAFRSTAGRLRLVLLVNEPTSQCLVANIASTADWYFRLIRVATGTVGHKIDVNVRRYRQARMICEFLAAIPRQDL